MGIEESEVAGPIPKSYTGCTKCKGAVNKDCGEHSMDFAWRGIVARLHAIITRLTNERDRWKAKHEQLSRKRAGTGKGGTINE